MKNFKLQSSRIVGNMEYLECLRLKIIERLLKEGSSAEEPINIPLSDYSSDEGSSSSSDNEGKGSIKDFSDLEGPCCHPLRAPPCSPELDAEIRKPLRIKFRFKSLHRRKKDERLLLDMPTTDPGSDLLFSTDDEYIDANGVVTCCGTMPRVRRNLLKSELQRRYIEEIGDGLRNMPPELIITSPSNKAKHRNHSVRILYKPAPERYERRQTTTNELPYIEEPAKQTSSWHNLNFNGQSPTLTPNKQITRNKVQSPFYKPIGKKEPLSKEDLDIKLSLKKKIWAGIQPDDTTLRIDRSRPLSWVASNSLKPINSKKSTGITGDQTNNGNNLAVPSNSNNIKKLENEAFLTACSRKLMEWQILNSNPVSPRGRTTKIPLKLIMPEINEDRTMEIFKHLANVKKPCTPNAIKSDNENKLKAKRNTITKIAETSKILTKITKCKTRSNLAISNRSMVKQTGNPQKSHGRGSKFKTGSIVVTAVQPIGGNTKRNKKTKSQHNKLSDANCSKNNTNNGNGGMSSNAWRPSTNSGDGMVMAATATTVVHKVKTKLKKKKLSTNNTQNISPITNYNNSGDLTKL